MTEEKKELFETAFFEGFDICLDMVLEYLEGNDNKLIDILTEHYLEKLNKYRKKFIN